MNPMTDKQDCWYDNTGKQTTNILWRAMGVKLSTHKTTQPLTEHSKRKIKQKTKKQALVWIYAKPFPKTMLYVRAITPVPLLHLTQYEVDIGILLMTGLGCRFHLYIMLCHL